MENITTSFSHEEIKMVAFSFIDYTVFGGMLAMSVLIGIYFGFCSKQDTEKDYLLGGKTMKVFPIALSLIASHISGITMLGVPADVYIHGANYWWIIISIVIVCTINAYIFLPVFFKLQFTSCYEYFSMRFDKKVRTFASFLFTLSVFLYNPVVIYIPALAFSQATGINLHLITPIVCIICIFYTTIGGLKAVVWTDALQFIGIIGTSIVIFFVGANSAGGFGEVWQRGIEGKRLELLNLDPNPTFRDGIWQLLIGGTVHWICIIAVHQGAVQKYLAVPTINDAKKALAIYTIGMIIIKSLSVFTGIIMFAKYMGCDPLTTKQVTRNDQLLPYFVMDIMGSVPGLPGLFIAGVFSAALSTLSATLNTVSGTIYEDFLSKLVSPKITQKQISNILKVIVVISGAICTALVFIIERMGGMVPFVTAFQGITGGPLLGLFILGLLFPHANAKGALWGGIIGLITISWIAFGNQWYKMNGLVDEFVKPLSIDKCDAFINVSVTTFSPPTEQPFILYRISFWYNTLIGTTVSIIVGLVVSLLTNDGSLVHPDLISPAVYFLLPQNEKEHAVASNCDDDAEPVVQEALLNSVKEKE